MRQLQEAQLKQMAGKDVGLEAVKPGISVLPVLEAPGKDSSPVDIQDWLEEVGGIMGDLSDSSSSWWSRAKRLAEERYQEWVTSGPMEKLTLEPPRSMDLEEGKYARVNVRAAGMVLAALPQEVKAEMIARKATGSTSCLVFRLLTMYRPGGEAEKTLLLQQLTSPEPSTSAEQAVQSLRRWSRWLTRARDLTVTVPDPVLMVKGLNNVVAKVLGDHQDVWLRSSLMRAKLGLDANPTLASTLDYHRHLQAEMELLATSTVTTKPSPKIKSVETPSNPASSSTAVKTKATAKSPLCKLFAKVDEGCKYGAGCRFVHEWGGVAKRDRCHLCSGKGHFSKQCPTKVEPKAKASPKGTKGKGKGAGEDGGDEKVAKAAVMEPEPHPSPATSSPTSPKNESQAKDGEPQQQDLREMLGEATQAIRSLLASGASSSTSSSSTSAAVETLQRQLDEIRLKVMRLEKEPASGGTFALLDSGATNILREAKSSTELQGAKLTQVVLAGDTKRELHQTEEGTIIARGVGPERVQTIIPMGALVDSGYKVVWTKGKLSVSHPEYGRLRTRVTSGCPEVANEEAMKIVERLEGRKRKEELSGKLSMLKAKIDSLADVEARPWTTWARCFVDEPKMGHLVQMVMKAPLFEGMAEAMVEKLVPMEGEIPKDEKDGWQLLKQLPLSRAKRKALMRSASWMVRVCPAAKGQNPEGALLEELRNQHEILDLGAELLKDVDGAAVRVLFWAAATGRVKCWWWRFEDKEGTKSQREAQVAMSFLMYVVSKFATPLSEQVGYVAEGENAWSDGERDLWRRFQKVTDMALEPVKLGAETKTLFTNYDVMVANDQDKGQFASSADLWRRVVDAVALRAVMGPRVRAMSAKQRAEWRTHLLHDHTPFRRDCTVCTQAAALGRPHRTSKFPQCALAVDTAGPFRHLGRDINGKSYRYLLVGAYRAPRVFLPAAGKSQKEMEQEKEEGPEVPQGEPNVEEAFPPGDDPMEVDNAAKSDEDELVEYEPSLSNPSDVEEEIAVKAVKEQALSSGEAKEEKGEKPMSSLDKEISMIKGALEYETIYIVRPQHSRKSAETLRSIQEMRMEVVSEGLPLHRLHSDTAREFSTDSLKTWCAEHDIVHTRTSGAEPAANSSAEVGVKWAKKAARTLLSSAKAAPEEWPMAVAHAAAKRKQRLLRPGDPHLPAFGQEVWFRAKTYVGAKESAALKDENKDVPPRWRRGYYRGPASDVPNGHLVMRSDGGLLIAKGIRAGLVDPTMVEPALLPELRAEVPEFVPPTRRARKKTTLGEREQEEDEPPQGLSPPERYAKGVLDKNVPVTRDEVEMLSALFPQQDLPRDVLPLPDEEMWSPKSWGAGAYIHGGVAGVRRSTTLFPYSTKVLTKFVKEADPTHKFNAVALFRNSRVRLHKDSHNSRDEPRCWSQ